MANKLLIDKELKIRNVQSVWSRFLALETPIVINAEKVETMDGVGFQLLIFILSLTEDFPDKYQIEGLTEKIIKFMAFYGYKFK